jgi:uncharacterized protein YegP (UPF0339 family)
MTGTFELFADETMCFRFALKSPDGTVVAVSRSFPDKQAAVAGISAVREYAGMGLITDLCPEVPARGSAAGSHAPDTRQNARPSTGGRSPEGLQPTAATGPPGLPTPRRAPAAPRLQKVA